MDRFASQKNISTNGGKLFKESGEIVRDEDANGYASFRRVEMNSVFVNLTSSEKSGVPNSEPSMTKSEQEGELSIVFRLADDVLDFFFTEGNSRNGFYLRGLYDLRGVLGEPIVLNAEVEERTEMAEFL